MASKRSHTKSRLGCKQCKKRRIKCDEVAPCCGNCAHKGMECEYQSWKGACENMQLFTPATYGKGTSPKPESCRSSPPTATPRSGSVSVSNESTASSGSFSLDDLGLLHYFTLHTSCTVGRQANEQFRWTWQHEVPRLAQTNKFLMHAVLGCAAADRAQSESVGEMQYLDWNQARYHYDRSIAFFRESFAQVSAEKAEALLCFSILVMLLTVCLDSQRPVEQQDPIEVFINLMQTVHHSVKVLELVKDKLRSSIIGACLLPDRREKHIQPIGEDVANALGVVERLAARYNVATNNASACGIADALVKLRQFHSLTTPRPIDWSWLLSWIVDLKPEFAILLQQRNPLALCMVAHWCVGLCNAPARWHTGTWPHVLLLSISQRLQGTEWAEGLTWPLSASFGDMGANENSEFDFAGLPAGFDHAETAQDYQHGGSRERLEGSPWLVDKLSASDSEHLTL